MVKSFSRNIATGLLVMAGLFVALGCGSDGNPASSSGDNTNPPSDTFTGTIVISGSSFSPSTVTVSVGTTVTWRNDDVIVHTVTSDTGTELASSLLGQGDTYSHRFTTAGTYPYHCTQHPVMRGTVIVEP